MGLIYTRVDGRLIHGQVAVAWTRHVGAEKIIVVDDDTASDEIQCTLLELATPSGVKMEIYNLDDGVTALRNGAADKEKTMLIIKKPHTALSLIKRGVLIASVNIGGMYHEPGKKQYDKALFADEADIQIFQELKESQVELFYQIGPLNKKQDLFSVLG